MAYNKEVQEKATAKYRANKIDLIQFPTAKGNREKLKKYCSKRGLSMSQFINQLISEAFKDSDEDWFK